MFDFRLRGIELLPSTAETLKKHVCMVLAKLDPRLKNININNLAIQSSSLHTLGLLSKGTGFLISPGYVATAYHVIKDAYQITCLTPLNEFIDLELMKYSEQYDIALLKPKIKWSGGITINDVENTLRVLKKGELVFTVGYPLGYRDPEPILSVGFLSNIQESKGVQKLVANIAFNVGNSGGPLFTIGGKLIGVVVAKSLVSHPLINVISRVMEKPGVELVYGTVELAQGIKEELTLGKTILTLIKWISDNVQTNIGEAISTKHLVELLRE